MVQPTSSVSIGTSDVSDSSLRPIPLMILPPLASDAVRTVLWNMFVDVTHTICRAIKSRLAEQTYWWP